LENTESNEIEKNDTETVMRIAKMYRKTNPKILARAIKRGNYKRPLIVKFGERYHLVAGNTRLCTAAALGVNPKVFIADIDMINESEMLKGGKADNKSLIQISKKHNAKNYYHIDDMVKSLKKQVEMGLPIEMDHTDDEDKAKEIVYDHLWEDPKYYTKLKKSDIDETDASSSGSFEGPAFGSMVRRKITSIPNANLSEQEEEVEEATTSSSSGQYDVPAFGKTTKGGRRNPLKIDGPDSIYKGRAVKDKNFPKWGGPGGVFVKIKDKCKKFPYCNQGNTGAIEFLKEDKEIQTAINEVSKNLGIPRNEIEKIVLNEIKQIFI
jgi:hypothetical protein